VEPAREFKTAIDLTAGMLQVARKCHEDLTEVRAAVLTAMAALEGRRMWTPAMVRAVDREMR